MPVLRQHHERDYTVVPNSTIQDQRLSCRDLGLLVRMLQKPYDWKFTKQALLAELDLDGERSIQAGMKKLQELGYLEITRESRRKGKISRSVWTVRDTPQLQNAVAEQAQTKKQECSPPQLRYPATENAVDYKRNNNKNKTAVPALEGGIQLDGKYYYRDPSTGGYVEKEDA